MNCCLRIGTLKRLLIRATVAISAGSWARAHFGNPGGPAPQSSATNPSITMTSPSVSSGQSQSPFLASVPAGTATGTVLPLSIKDAIDRGLKYNLGLIESEQGSRASRAARLKNLNDLMPNVSARIGGTVEQVNLAAMGIKFPGVPTVVGPFGFADVRAYVSQTVFDWNSLKNLKAASENVKAPDYSYRSSRDTVVLAVGNAYLQVIASAALVDSARAQVKTAESLYQKSVDQKKAGVIAGIDELRAKVELQTQQQRLIAQENQFAKDKLTLARIIGLPTGQEFALTDTVPYAPLEKVDPHEALQRAYNSIISGFWVLPFW